MRQNHGMQPCSTALKRQAQDIRLLHPTPGMLHIRMLSGEELVAMPVEEVSSVREVTISPWELLFLFVYIKPKRIFKRCIFI